MKNRFHSILILLLVMLFGVLPLCSQAQVEEPKDRKFDLLKPFRRQLVRFPYRTFKKVIAYDLRTSPAPKLLSDAEKNWLKNEDPILIEAHFHPALKGQQGIELRRKQIIFLNNLMDQRRTYGPSSSTCQTPDFGFIYYNRKGKVVAHITVSMQCARLDMFPEPRPYRNIAVQQGQLGTNGYLGMRKLCRQLGLGDCDPILQEK